jgi:AAA+ superfamily predicted ATPase
VTLTVPTASDHHTGTAVLSSETAGLHQRLASLSGHVRRLVEERQRTETDPDNPYRGLYVSDDEARVLAAENGERSTESRDGGFDSFPIPSPTDPLGSLARSFGLDAFDLDVIVVVLAPDVEPRFEKLYGYLHDDLTRRRASIGLVLELTGRGFADPGGRRRFTATSRLVRHGLVLVEEPGRSTLTRPLRIPDRVAEFLLGVDTDDKVLRALTITGVEIGGPEVARFAQFFRNGARFLHLQDGASGVGAAVGASALRIAGFGALTIDLTRLVRADEADVVVRAAVREARLRNEGLVVLTHDAVTDLVPEVMALLADGDWPTVVVSPQPWNPSWSPHLVCADVAPRADGPTVAGIWAKSLPELAVEGLADATCQLRLRPDQIVEAARLARHMASVDGQETGVEHVATAARSQNNARLERLARRIRPAVSWSDLVVPADVARSLREVEVRFRRRDVVHGEWGLGGKNNRRLGVVTLFAGPSGVGKTMAAEALAASLGLDMYQVNLATVVDKYIGETEKNLERIFVAAEGVNGVILFDEADALFGKRSDVSDAKDRYANVEVAYLLQRLESYEGIAILATNLRTNIDEAFTRRLDALIDFPEPNQEHRRILWDRCLGPRVARADDLDLDFLADQFRLAGGNIRNIAVAAAFLAVARDRVVRMEDLVRATAQEYRKLGRLVTAVEFGPWLDCAEHF